jgi:hypothetical protein
MDKNTSLVRSDDAENLDILPDSAPVEAEKFFIDVL